MSSLQEGDKFGKLTLQYWTKGINGIRGYWTCMCECGGIRKVATTELRQGKTVQCKSCRSEYMKTRFSKKYSRKTDPVLYEKWSGMINRVRNHKHYLERGIEVCASWDCKQGGSFENFYNDMKDSYVEGYSLDRKDNDKGYNKDNCRWIELSCQSGNRKPDKNNEYKGITKTKEGKFNVGITSNNKYYSLGVTPSLERAKSMYDLAALNLRGEITFTHSDENYHVISKECNLIFHEITEFKYFTGGVFSTGKSLQSSNGVGFGFWFPSRSSVRLFGFDLRAVCRCLGKGVESKHLGHYFEDT